MSEQGPDIRESPGRFDFFRVMRDLERSAPDKPRIGDSTVMAEDVVSLAQDPYLTYPNGNVTELDKTRNGTPRLHTRFLGFFGPQGALPLSTTTEAYQWHWLGRQDRSFTRFVDIFSNRFQQLFFRTWANARPIAHHDRPNDDRFADYLGSFAGIGSDAFRDRDTVPDTARLPFAGLVVSAVKCARRLEQLLRGVLGLNASITEHVGSWLLFERSDLTALGARNSQLGSNAVVGQRAFSINEKFRITVKVESLEAYSSLLPNQPGADQIADLVFSYIGHRFEYDVALALPARCVPAAKIGVFGQLGWTSWVAPPSVPDDDKSYVTDARFDLAERRNARLNERRKTNGSRP